MRGQDQRSEDGTDGTTTPLLSRTFPPPPPEPPCTRATHGVRTSHHEGGGDITDGEREEQQQKQNESGLTEIRGLGRSAAGEGRGGGEGEGEEEVRHGSIVDVAAEESGGAVGGGGGGESHFPRGSRPGALYSGRRRRRRVENAGDGTERRDFFLAACKDRRRAVEWKQTEGEATRTTRIYGPRRAVVPPDGQGGARASLGL